MLIVQKFVRCVAMIIGFNGFRCYIGKNISRVLILNSNGSD